jgi:hypothetical protein
MKKMIFLIGFLSACNVRKIFLLFSCSVVVHSACNARKIFLIGLLFSIVFLSACNIDEYNPSGATANAVWTNPKGFLTLVNAAYSDQRAWYGKEDGVFMGESGTDLWFNSNKDNYANELTRYENFTPSTGNPNKVWQPLYRAINLCNAGISRIGQAGFTDSTERYQREGELRFLRAFYYWHIVETYGGVILSTQETSGVELTATRSPVKDFYKLITDDLIFAAKYLPVNYGAEYSRATKKSALGLLARAYLSGAYYYTGAEAQQWFKKAQETADEVISRKTEFGVELWADYADLWKPQNNKQNKEALYIVSNSTNTALNYDGNANRLHLWFLTTYSSKPGMQLSLEYGKDNSRRFMPTRALLDFYDERKDRRYTGSFQEVWICNKAYTWTTADVATYKKDPSIIGKQMIPGKDTALYVTKKSITDKATRPYPVIDRDSTYHTNGGAIYGGNDYVQLTKFMDPITRASAGSNPGYLDIFVIRLAEMYLIAAEAAFQQNDKGAAISYINVLRTRAAIKTPVDHTADMQITDISLDFILDERARELAGEHLRWFDLKRTGKLVDRIHQYNPDITQVQPFHMLRPVPQIELDALTNGQQFGQNEGYN